MKFGLKGIEKTKIKNNSLTSLKYIVEEILNIMDTKPTRLHNVEQFYDYLKHITTLSTESLLLLVTFAEKFAQAGRMKSLFAVGVAFFLASIVSCLISMLFVLSSKRYEHPEPNWENNTIIISFFLAVVCLLGGVLSMATFGIVNFGT